MRTLLLLRGAVGSGKSTFIKENDLEPYTLEADKFRLLISNPKLTKFGNFEISQKNDRMAWEILFNCLEERMKKGEFTIIDATHTTKRAMNSYKFLADKYKYTIYYYQLDTPLEKCIENNKKRESYKQVDENVINRMFKNIQTEKISGSFKRISDISEIINFYVADVSEKYKKVRIIGDVHSCFTALSEIMKDFDENTLYVFLGDFLDRGIEHKQTLSLILNLYNRENVIMIEGNHEIHLENFANDFKINSKDFLNETLPAILENEQNIDNFKKEIRKFYKKLRQCYAFKFHNYKILCTHAGLSFVPNLALVSTSEMINKVGSFETEIGELYEENYLKGKCQDFIQVHGHRGVNSTEHSICLEGEVEFGGELKYLDVMPDKIVLKSVINTVYDKDYLQHELEKAKENKQINLTANEDVNKLIVSKLIGVKKTKPNLYSLNFGRNVFRKKLWNDSTIKARGLFVDAETGKVKIRSYNKFFNYDENKYSTREYIEKNIVYPVTAYEKYNGFLGILSVIDGKFVFATKSVTNGTHVKYFENIFEKASEKMKNEIFKICAENDVSIVFEVISNEDRHIVDYFGQEALFVLDVIDNSLFINGIHVDKSFSENFLCKLNFDDKVIKMKKEIKKCGNFDEIIDLMENYDNFENAEGIVFCAENGFMFKYKAKHYSLWKKRRGILEFYRKDFDKMKLAGRYKNEHEFVDWLAGLDDEKVEKAHIIDLMNEYESSRENN